MLGIRRSGKSESLRLSSLLLVILLFMPCLLVLVSTAQAGPDYKAVIIIGNDCGSQDTENAYNSLASELQNHGIRCYKFYTPNAKWSEVQTALEDANIVVYWGHGCGWDPGDTEDDQDFKNGFSLDQDNSYPNTGDDWYRLTGTIDRRIIHSDISKLAPNALVVLHAACYSAGKTALDMDEYTPVSTLKKRIEEYSESFLTMGANYYGAIGYTAAPHYIFQKLLDEGKTLKQTAEELDQHEGIADSPYCEDVVIEGPYSHPQVAGEKVRFLRWTWAEGCEGAGTNNTEGVIAGNMNLTAPDFLPGYEPPPQPPKPTDASAFYFAEGYTGSGFEEYICIGNPSDGVAIAAVTYMFADGTTQEASYNVPGNSRFTVNVNGEVGPGREVAAKITSQTANLVVERPMYFNYKGIWTGGSDVVGATAPCTSWYFAEGTTLEGFEQYITVLNPSDETANLTFRYMIEGSGEQDIPGQVGAHSRSTFKTLDQIGPDKNASLVLESDQPVVAERPMYSNYHGVWSGGHDVVGATSPSMAWYFAEGTTRTGFEEWLCLQNPGTTSVTIDATYQLALGQGNPIAKTYSIPAQQRLTVPVNAEIGQDKDCSVSLISESDFIAERPMYFNYHEKWTGGHDVLGSTGHSTTWFFAEGTTRDNFDEWLCLQNPGAADSHAEITYYLTTGQTVVKSWTVPANSRITVNVNADVGPNQDVSACVFADNPLVAERPMYFMYNGFWDGGHDVGGFVPTL